MNDQSVHVPSLRAFTCSVFWRTYDGRKVWGKTICSCGFDPGLGDAPIAYPEDQLRLVDIHIEAANSVSGII